jgi:tRNA nucleotidyltransferase/poly(A) polymerase
MRRSTAGGTAGVAEAEGAALDAATAARLRDWAGGWPELAAARALRPGAPIHLVGGAVRDVLLGGAPKDVDLVLPGEVAGLARQLAGRFGGARVPLHDDPPTERVALADGRTLDLAAYRGADLAADLRARDFTVNALALDLAALLGDGPLRVVDPTGGLADLRRGLARLTWSGAIEADPLRLLRAYRLIATAPPPLGGGGRWRLTTATATQIRRRRHLLRLPARERVAAELIQILASPRAATVVRAMEGAGVLAAALPVLSSEFRVPSSEFRLTRAYSALGTQHSALRRLGRARRNLAAVVGAERAGRLAAALDEELSVGRPRAALLGWLALTLARAEARRLPTEATLALTGAVADSLRVGRREAGEARAVARALIGGDLLAAPATPAEASDRRAALAALGEATPGALLLTWARGRGRETARLRAELDRFWGEVAPILAAPPLLDGAALMAALDLPPGPALGRLLSAIRAAQIRGEIATPDDALALARRLHGSQ